MSRSYEDMFRPTYEAPAFASWSAASVLLTITQPPLWPAFAFATLGMAGIRGKQAFDLYKFRASISAQRAEFISVKDAVAISKRLLSPKDSKAFWLGRGFTWTQKHAENARRIMYLSPDELAGPPKWLPKAILKAIEPPDTVPLKEDAIGVSWIHGLGEVETEIRLPLDALPGHTLIVGTTRAGKTKLYILLSTQIIHKEASKGTPDPLIIIDPKGDKDWLEAVKRECERTGRKFLYFNPAHPSKSIRLDPLANWNNMSEPATRIGQLVDADGSFSAFAWKTLFRIMRGMVMDGTRPNIRAVKKYVQGGIETLLEDLILKKLVALEGAKWDSNLDSFASPDQSKNKQPLKSPKLEKMIGKYQHLGIDDEAIDSLISMANHSKEHYSKMIQVLEPIMEMLGSAELGAMLSPDPLDLSDTRPIYDTQKIIDEGAVLYMGLDSLSDKTIGQAIGSVFMADLASTTGAIYNFQEKKDVYLIVDESAEIVNDQSIQLLNKGGGAGVKGFFATQTISDLDVVLGSAAKTKQALGNLNNIFCLRVKDPEMAKWIAESFGSTSARRFNVSHSTGSGSTSSFTEFTGSTSRSMSEEEVPFVAPDMLTRLPGLQYFAFIGGSQLYKGRIPIIGD